MQCIPVTQAVPGMVLAQAVARSNGPVLVGKGMSLTEAVINRINASGVATIWVEGNPLGQEGNTGGIREVAESLPYMFRRQKDNVFMMTLCKLFERHFATRLAEQKAREDAAQSAADHANENVDENNA